MEGLQVTPMLFAVYGLFDEFGGLPLEAFLAD
jgi:hypothetical protein